MLLPNSRVHQFGNGEVLMHQGEIGDFFHILRRGTVEVVAHATNGGSIHIADVKAPAFVGEIALLTGEPRNASVVARSDVEVLELNRDAFTHLFQQRPESLNEISEVVAGESKKPAASSTPHPFKATGAAKTGWWPR